MWSMCYIEYVHPRFGSGQNNEIFQEKHLWPCMVLCYDEGHSDVCRSGTHHWQRGLEKEQFTSGCQPFLCPMEHHCSEWKPRHGCYGQRMQFPQCNKVTGNIHRDVIYFPVLLQRESLVGSIKSLTLLHTLQYRQIFLPCLSNMISPPTPLHFISLKEIIFLLPSLSLERLSECKCFCLNCLLYVSHWH